MYIFVYIYICRYIYIYIYVNTPLVLGYFGPFSLSFVAVNEQAELDGFGTAAYADLCGSPRFRHPWSHTPRVPRMRGLGFRVSGFRVLGFRV